ncbi:MAG: hypothetical protein V1729_03305 [Candidatus Woesearchaeota archaeon]
MEFTLKAVTRETCYSQHELDSAIKSVKAKKNILILAPDKFGKSSFLLKLSEKIEETKQYLPILLSAQGCITLQAYIRKNLTKMLKVVPELFGADPEELFSLSLIDIDKRVSALNAGDAVKQSLKLLLMFEHDSKIEIEEVVRTFFSFPSLLAKDAKKTAVIMIDDAERLSDIKSDKTSLAMIFDMFDTMEDSVWVFTSSRALPIKDIEELRLSPLSIDSARQFFKEGKLELDEATLSTIHNMTEGVPFYLNFMARLISGSGSVDSDAVKAMLDDVLGNELHLYFSERIKLLSPKELPILFCMAEHDVNTPSRISKILNYSQTNVRRFLSIMEEKGFVTLKDRGVFEINDPIFRRWLETQAKR